jgi:ferredoxin--NADP+ reductase
MSWKTARVIGRQDWGPRLFSLVLDAAFEPHEPGQFASVALTVDGARTKRAYSFASAPGEPPEFYVVAVEGGVLSPALMKLCVGDALEVDARPHGFFVPSELPPSKNLWLFATGTGLGPYVAMVRDGRIFERHADIILVHSVREASHLGYREELENLAAADPRFTYLPTLTRESNAGMLSGRIDTLLERGKLESAANRPIEPASTHVMLCGNPAMLDAMRARLDARGMRRHRRREPGHVTSETYW